MPKKTKPTLQDIFVSVILLVDDTSRDVSKQLEHLSRVLASNYTNYEILLLDNFMKSAELKQSVALLNTFPCIRIIRLSKKDTMDTAAFAGLETAIGDHVVLMVASHDPISQVAKIVEKNKKTDIIYGISKRQMRQGLLNKYGAELFYWYNKRYLGVSVPSTSTYFMALNRSAVNAVTRSGRFARHIRYMIHQVGYSSEQFKYSPLRMAIPEKKSPQQLAMSALELATNYSKHPLRFVAWFGFAIAFLNLFYVIYVAVVRIFKHHVAEGWTTLSIQSAVMFFFMFSILAVLCEYIGRILEESRDEQPYHIMDELNSKVSLADVTRRNIIK
jgi:hypothetical protein